MSQKEFFVETKKLPHIVDSLETDDGVVYPAVIYEPGSRRENFANNYCNFLPAGWVDMGGWYYPLTYRVVTADMCSLGLRNNPNIIEYPIGLWVVLPENQITYRREDWGGIWTARTQGGALSLVRFCREEKGMETRLFLSAVCEPVYASRYRVKSKGIILLKEIH